MTQHTPGPWTAFIDGRTMWIEPPNHNETVICDITHGKDRSLDVDAANANLIAAAPELLAACELAFDEMMRNDFGTLTLAPKILVAIHKARGQ